MSWKAVLEPRPAAAGRRGQRQDEPQVPFARNSSIANLIDDFGMVQFLPLKAKDPDSVATILSYIDDVTQWAEAQEPSNT